MNYGNTVDMRLHRKKKKAIPQTKTQYITMLWGLKNNRTSTISIKLHIKSLFISFPTTHYITFSFPQRNTRHAKRHAKRLERQRNPQNQIQTWQKSANQQTENLNNYDGKTGPHIRTEWALWEERRKEKESKTNTRNQNRNKKHDQRQSEDTLKAKSLNWNAGRKMNRVSRTCGL